MTNRIIGDRTTKHVIDELIQKADSHSTHDMIRGDLRSQSDHPQRLEYNSNQIGKLVLELSKSDRKLIENLTPDDLGSLIFNGWGRCRPKNEELRQRNPVKLG